MKLITQGNKLKTQKTEITSISDRSTPKTAIFTSNEYYQNVFFLNLLLNIFDKTQGKTEVSGKK